MDRFCRGCLVRFEEPTDLLQYTEKNRRLFVYSTGIQVKRTDPFTFQLCKDCYLHMKAACNFKKQCRNSDKRFKSYLGLKENADNLDLSTYLKNSDDSWSFRFPGNSTPAYQRVKDDDNESTTTSIRNFMMDIMPDDVLPDTEARIIKEVIDEEADILEDSMDSHWLQDDASIDTDFRLDFSFSPFSTPRPVNNDRYTPSKSVKKAIQKTKESKQIDAVTKKVLDNLDMPLIDDESNHYFVPLIERNVANNDTVKEEKNEKYKYVPLLPIKAENYVQSNHPLLPIKEERNLNETMDSLDVVNEFLNYESENANHMDVVSPSLSTIDRHLNEALENIDEEVKAATQRIIDRNLEEVLEDKDKEKTSQCTIDRNLEEALKYTGNKEFSLDELLVSPQVIPGIQSPPTPLINNILFGEKLDMDETSNSSQRYKAGRCIETFENVTGDVEMSEDFTTSMDIKLELDLEEIKGEMIDEIERQANQKNLCCKVCQKKFEDIEHLERHSKRHHIFDELNEIVDEIVTDVIEEKGQFDITNFYCNMCNKKFKNLRTFEIHAKRHQMKNKSQKKFICHHCGKEMADRTNFLRHLRTHARPPKKYKCEECNLEFGIKNAYNQHKRTHKGQKQVLLPLKKRFVCTECGMSTDKLSNFTIHMKRHQKSYTHTCTECDKGFFRQSELTIHMSMLFKNKNETTFVCSVEFCRAYCGPLRQSELTIHIRLHTGEKPFACPYCSLRFVRRDGLTRHIKCHLDLKPFQCKYCKTRFVNNTNFRNHLKKSTRCVKDREAIARAQKKFDDYERDYDKSFVTEELLITGEKHREEIVLEWESDEDDDETLVTKQLLMGEKNKEKIDCDQVESDDNNVKTFVTEELLMAEKNKEKINNDQMESDEDNVKTFVTEELLMGEKNKEKIDCDHMESDNDNVKTFVTEELLIMGEKSKEKIDCDQMESDNDNVKTFVTEELLMGEKNKEKIYCDQMESANDYVKNFVTEELLIKKENAEDCSPS